MKIPRHRWQHQIVKCATIELRSRVEIVASPPPVLTKKDFVERYACGEFGNASPTWQTFEEWYDSTFPSWYRYRPNELFHLRNRIAGGETIYDSKWGQLYEEWAKRHFSRNWYCSAMCPHQHNVLQGNVLLTPQGLYLNYTRAPGPYREAFSVESKHATGIMAVCLLRQALNPVSYDWLQVLLERYPDHVVEFTALSVEWGTLPGYNTLFWEVRNY